MIKGIDHIVILVNDLDAATEDYRALGFSVAPGGEHTGGATHNALVAFEDGSYLELLAFRRAAPDHRWWRHVAIGEGLIDYALLPDAIEQDLAEMRARGLKMDGPSDGGRQRPDGRRIEWRTGHPATSDLPFLCADVTPRDLRVPSGEAWRHDNGAAGIAGLTVAVADLAASATRYRSLLNRPPAPDLPPGAPAGARTASFHLGGAVIGLAQPQGEGQGAAELRRKLAAAGDGLYALALRSTKLSQPEVLDVNRTHGAHIVIVPA